MSIENTPFNFSTLVVPKFILLALIMRPKKSLLFSILANSELKKP